MSVRVRMAPSPTGFLHIGGVRTFLFNWLFARQQGGECLLRIENTDTSREVADVRRADPGVAALARDRLGRPGHLPARHRRTTARELRRAAARRAATPTRTRARSASAMPDEGVVWLGGRRARPHRVPERNLLPDLVLVRGDGRPTYNFASARSRTSLDGITHVIRGNDHVSNTPSQINILRALGAELPVYAHVPTSRRRRQEALQAPRRRLDRRLPRRGLPTRRR